MLHNINNLKIIRVNMILIKLHSFKLLKKSLQNLERVEKKKKKRKKNYKFYYISLKNLCGSLRNTYYISH